MNRTIIATAVCATAIWIGLLVASFAPAPATQSSGWQPSSKLLVRAKPAVTQNQVAHAEQ